MPMHDMQLISKWSSFSKKEILKKELLHLQATLEEKEEVWVTIGGKKAKEQMRRQANTPRFYCEDVEPLTFNSNILREQERHNQDDDGTALCRRDF